MQYEFKKQLEKLLIDLFKENCPDFPKGKLLETESPDFIVRASKKLSYGIELTRLYPESQKTRTLEKTEQIKLQDELIEMIRKRVEEECQTNCFVKILFMESNPVTEERMLSLAVRLSRLLINNGFALKSGKAEQLILSKNLPEGIQSVMMFTHPGLHYSVWERSNNLGISTNLIKDIHHSINKKDEKLKLYEQMHLDRYWLLITSDRLVQEKPVNIFNLLQKTNFHSDFDKVIILELFNKKAILVK